MEYFERVDSRIEFGKKLLNELFIVCHRHGEISNALKLYKKGALARTFGAINKVHHSAIDFEKFFAEGMKDTLTEAWQSHVRILSSLMDWMTKLLELHNGGRFSGKEPSSSDTSTSQVEWNSDESSNSESMQELVARATRPRSGHYNLYILCRIFHRIPETTNRYFSN